jgi:hypothetical protein
VAGLLVEASRLVVVAVATELTTVAIWADAKAATLVGSRVAVLATVFVEPLVEAGAALVLTLVTVLLTTVFAKDAAAVGLVKSTDVPLAAVIAAAAPKAAF